jgi:catechol 2,3-dioxygenase-like lactoylglutathione lyase family enzyme
MADQIKVHVALNVSRFEESVKFYRAMFGVEPVKWKPNYAKFDIAEPPLNLTLNYGGEVKHQGALNHLGIEVPSTAEVLAAKERLQNIGLVTTDEMNVECCFALQDKLWIVDPNGNRWEIFTVKVQDTQPDLTIQQANNRPQQTCCRE